MKTIWVYWFPRKMLEKAKKIVRKIPLHFNDMKNEIEKTYEIKYYKKNLNIAFIFS